MGALFWRPGAVASTAVVPLPPHQRAFLCCDPGNLSVGAAVVLSLLACTSSELRRSLGIPLSVDVDALSILGDSKELFSNDNGDCRFDEMLTALHALKVLPMSACAPRGAGTSCDTGGYAAATAQEVPDPADEACGVSEEREQRTPLWSYKCRKCCTLLFHDINILPHFVEGEQKARRDWAPVQNSETEEPITCTSMFIEPMRWMGELEGQTGRLLCGNPSCKQKLGAFSWHGLPC